MYYDISYLYEYGSFNIEHLLSGFLQLLYLVTIQWTLFLELLLDPIEVSVLITIVIVLMMLLITNS